VLSSAGRNLPDSPFASPTKSAAFARDPFTSIELEISGASTFFSNASFVGANNGGSLTNHLRPSALDIPSPKNYFPMSRYPILHPPPPSLCIILFDLLKRNVSYNLIDAGCPPITVLVRLGCKVVLNGSE
jgi:hypothetical protein